MLKTSNRCFSKILFFWTYNLFASINERVLRSIDDVKRKNWFYNFGHRFGKENYTIKRQSRPYWEFYLHRMVIPRVIHWLQIHRHTSYIFLLLQMCDWIWKIPKQHTSALKCRLKFVSYFRFPLTLRKIHIDLRRWSRDKFTFDWRSKDTSFQLSYGELSPISYVRHQINLEKIEWSEKLNF